MRLVIHNTGAIAMSGATRGKQVRRGAGQWRELLARFDASRLAVAPFCRRESVSTASFYPEKLEGALLRQSDALGIARHRRGVKDAAGLTVTQQRLGNQQRRLHKHAVPDAEFGCEGRESPA